MGIRRNIIHNLKPRIKKMVRKRSRKKQLGIQRSGSLYRHRNLLIKNRRNNNTGNTNINSANEDEKSKELDKKLKGFDKKVIVRLIHSLLSLLRMKCLHLHQILAGMILQALTLLRRL
jgi:hypothetical protein